MLPHDALVQISCLGGALSFAFLFEAGGERQFAVLHAVHAEGGPVLDLLKEMLRHLDLLTLGERDVLLPGEGPVLRLVLGEGSEADRHGGATADHGGVHCRSRRLRPRDLFKTDWSPRPII